ncbi:MAG: single-stranded DNA-binding protein [Saprospiraceae bacterium]|jgi:single-strand DNA-binding protein|nr:single-stranded DNA-binding protein [Saprospiraceae bacterium]
MFNKVTLIGNLGRDPEIRTLENGTKVGTFSLATNENYRDKNDQWQTLTEWHTIVVWRGLAEKAERDLKKGHLVFVEGKLTHRKYQDKEGVERTVTEIVASVIQSLEKREVRQPGISAGFPGIEDDFQSKTSQTTSTPSGVPDDNDLPF